MNFKNLILELKETGLGERQIARLVGTSQSSIRHMQYRGGQPLYNTGAALVELRKTRLKEMSDRWSQ